MFGELTQNLDAHWDTQPQWFLLMEIGALDEVLQHMKELIGSTLPPKVPLDMAFNETYDFVTEQIRWRGVRWQESVHLKPISRLVGEMTIPMETACACQRKAKLSPIG